MRNMKFKNMFIMIALMMALMFSAGISQAAQVSIVGPSTVMAGGSFTFDVMIDDLGGLPNIDGFNLVLELTPQTNAKFQTIDFTTSNLAYVFYGNSDGIMYEYYVGNSYILGVADMTDSGSGVAASDAIGSLMVTIGVDVTSAIFDELYTVSIYDAFPNLINDDTLNPSAITLADNYSFHVVPIPGAIWLLGTGLIGLVGLRRKTRT